MVTAPPTPQTTLGIARGRIFFRSPELFTIETVAAQSRMTSPPRIGPLDPETVSEVSVSQAKSI